MLIKGRAVQFVVHNFESQYLLAGPNDRKRKSPTFKVGGYTWYASASCTLSASA